MKNSKIGLFVRLESKKGKETEVENFLRSGLSLVEGEPNTLTWFAVRLGPSTFGIFDTFADASAKQEHLSGKVAEALFAKAGELLSQPPVIENIEILASMLRTES